MKRLSPIASYFFKLKNRIIFLCWEIQPLTVSRVERTFFRLLPWALLIFLGCVWGLTFSLARLSVDVGGKPLGMTFWQCLIGGILLLIFSLIRKRPPSFSVANVKVYITVALLGASIPTSILYFAAKHVQAGILSITVALIPMITYSFAAFLRTESFSVTRIFGVLLGCVSVGL